MVNCRLLLLLKFKWCILLSLKYVFGDILVLVSIENFHSLLSLLSFIFTGIIWVLFTPLLSVIGRNGFAAFIWNTSDAVLFSRFTRVLSQKVKSSFCAEETLSSLSAVSFQTQQLVFVLLEIQVWLWRWCDEGTDSRWAPHEILSSWKQSKYSAWRRPHPTYTHHDRMLNRQHQPLCCYSPSTHTHTHTDSDSLLHLSNQSQLNVRDFTKTVFIFYNYYYFHF